MITERQIKEHLTSLIEVEGHSNLGDMSLEGLILAGIHFLMKREINPIVVPTTEMTEDIIKFHKKFKQEYSGPPRMLPHEYSWRDKFIKEELKEFQDAKTLVKKYDALVDMLFVINGTMYIMGLDIKRGWDAVYESNMTKEYVEWGKGKHGSTVHKGQFYAPPTDALRQILVDCGYDFRHEKEMEEANITEQPEPQKLIAITKKNGEPEIEY